MRFNQYNTPLVWALALATCFLWGTQLLFAQSPGGVSTTNLRAWYRAQTGVTLTGGAVSQWNDQSSFAQNGTQTTAANRPIVNATGFNYQESILFDGQNDRINIPAPIVPTGSTGISVFAVARQAGTTRDPWGCVVFGQSNSATWAGGGFGLTALAAANTSFGFWVNTWDANFVANASTLNTPTIMTGSWNGTTANNVQYFANGASAGTDPFVPGTVGNTGPSAIGSSGNDSYSFWGDIAEVAIFNTGLSATDVNRVNTYLAVKYGITLSTNYINSGSTTIYSNTAPYNQFIIGIGRDDASGLLQRQSRMVTDSTRIYIGSLATNNAANSAGFGANNQFVMAGSDGGILKSIPFDPEKPAGISHRIRREWKVTNTNFSSIFSFDALLNVGTPPIAADMVLLVDDDGDFSNAAYYDAADGLTISTLGNRVTFAGINNSMIPANSTRYITIGSISGSTTLPVGLLYFSAMPLQNKVLLSWSTSTEINHHHFTIWRSTDAANWTLVKRIPGTGNSNTQKNYQTIDAQPLPGKSYYRLQQTDNDGRYRYAAIVPVLLNQHLNKIRVFPNPASHQLQIEVPGNEAFEVRMTDLNGHTVYFGKNQTQIRIADLPEGLYMLWVAQRGKEPINFKVQVKR